MTVVTLGCVGLLATSRIVYVGHHPEMGANPSLSRGHQELCPAAVWSTDMVEVLVTFVGLFVVAVAYLAFISVHLIVWAGLFWFAAWLFPALEALAQAKLGVSLATVGAGVGLLSLVWQRPTVTVKAK
jgi:hypothetical protein